MRNVPAGTHTCATPRSSVRSLPALGSNDAAPLARAVAVIVGPDDVVGAIDTAAGVPVDGAGGAAGAEHVPATSGTSASTTGTRIDLLPGRRLRPRRRRGCAGSGRKVVHSGTEHATSPHQTPLDRSRIGSPAAKSDGDRSPRRSPRRRAGLRPRRRRPYP